MSGPRLRDPARRAEAERYLRASRAKLSFWVAAWLLFPLVNGGLVLATGAITQSTSWLWVVAIVLLVGEAAALYRLAQVFAKRARAPLALGGMLAVGAVSMLVWWAIAFAWIATRGFD